MTEVQTEAIVAGEAVTELPNDLYIPPDALKVILEAFEGPLDLLLYLIKKQNVDILEIPIAKITEQYVQYIELMGELQLELAGEYLLMAAMLAEIKSRILLPRPVEEEGDENDPRAELVRRLQEYEQIKKAAEDLDLLPRYERDIFKASTEAPEMKNEVPLPDLQMQDLIMAFKDVLRRTRLMQHHQIAREALSIRERMSLVLSRLQEKSFLEFTSLFSLDEGKMGVVVSFVAILELLKQSMIEIVQAEPFSQIHIRVVEASHTP